MTGPAIGLPERLPSAPSDAGKSFGRNGAGDAPGGFQVALSRVGGGGGAKGHEPPAASDARTPGTGRWPALGPQVTAGDRAGTRDQDRTETTATETTPEGEAPAALASAPEPAAPSPIVAVGDGSGTGATATRALEQLAAVFAGFGPTAAAKDAGTPAERAAAGQFQGAAFGKGVMAAVRFVLAGAEEPGGAQSGRAGGPVAGAGAGSIGEAITAVAASGSPSLPEGGVGADKASAGLSPALPGAVTPAQTPSVTVLRQETHLPPVAQVAERVVEMLESTAGRPAAPKDATRILELQLRPAELGTVRISLRLNDGRLEVELRTERAETGQLLEKDRPRLARALADAGYQTDSLAVSSIGERPHVRVAAGPQLSPGLSGDFGAALGGGTASGGGAAGDGNAQATRSLADGPDSHGANDAERIDDGEAHDRDGLYL